MWDQLGPEVSAWDVEIVPMGMEPNEPPLVSGIDDDRYTWSDGESDTWYDFYVRAQCPDADEVSIWNGPFSFKTTVGCGDAFFDTGGPNASYQNNESERWNICPSNEGEVVTIEFTSLDINLGFERLRIYSGMSTDTPLDEDIDAPTTFTSIAEDGCLSVRWRSSPSATPGAGWEATISCAPPSSCAPPFEWSTNTATISGISFDWIQPGDDVTEWEFEILSTGELPTGNANITGVSSNFYTWEGGEPATTYDAYLRGVCTAEGTGFTTWVGPITFTTAPSCGQPFYDSGGPDGPFANNGMNSYEICPDIAGASVVVDFSFVNINSFVDQLAVYDGRGTDIPLELDLEVPGTFYSTAPDGCLTVTFYSIQASNEIFNQGWEATVNCSSCPVPFLLDEIFVADSSNNATTIAVAASDELPVDIEFGPAGFTLGGGQMVAGVTSGTTLMDLAENTTYDFYVTGFCTDTEDVALTYGPLQFSTLHTNDVGVTGLNSPDFECGIGINEPFQVLLQNSGFQDQSGFTVNCQINHLESGEMLQVETAFTDTLAVGQALVFTTDSSYDFPTPGMYEITIWTTLATDTHAANDTFTISYLRYPTPFVEDFEDSELTSGLRIGFPESIFSPGAHGNASGILGVVMNSTGDFSQIFLPVIENVNSTDVLSFDYRFVNWPSGTTPATNLTADDRLSVMVSTDCRETYEMAFELTGTMHEPTTNFTSIEVPLGYYVGESIFVQIRMSYGNSEYWYDLDNINVERCASLNADLKITNATDGLANGAVVMVGNGGVGTYTFTWEDGYEGPFRDGLAPGTYDVVMQDEEGCSKTYSITIETVSNIAVLPSNIQSINLYPNPTTDGRVQLQAQFMEKAKTVQITVYNLTGQSVWVSPQWADIQQFTSSIDLNNLAPGIYQVKLQVDNQYICRRLVITK